MTVLPSSWCSVINHYAYVYVYVLLTLTLRKGAAQREMDVKGGCGCRQTVMYDPGAQQPMFLTGDVFDLGKGQTTTPRTP